MASPSIVADLPFTSKRAIAAHFRVHERTVFGWVLKHDWPTDPTPRSVAEFLERNGMDSSPAKQRTDLLARFDEVFDPGTWRLRDHVEKCQEAARALPPGTAEHCLADIDETVITFARALVKQMNHKLTAEKLAQFLVGNTDAILREINPYIESE